MTQALATTVVVASLYALLAAGYVLVYRATRVLNLAQGDMMTLGGYFLFFLAAAVPGRPTLSIVTAALLYLMTHYARTGCPRLAICISRRRPTPEHRGLH